MVQLNLAPLLLFLYTFMLLQDVYVWRSGIKYIPFFWQSKLDMVILF